MGELLFEFKASHKAMGGIETDVAVYDDKIELKRKVSGVIALNTKLPSETIAYYNELKGINYVKPNLASGNVGWIELVGVSRNQAVTQTVNVNGSLISNADIVNGMKNPYNIVFNKNKAEMEDCYKKIKEAFEKYSVQQKNNQGVTNIILDETALDKIKKLKDLLDMGAISQEEFEKKKNELMKNI